MPRFVGGEIIATFAYMLRGHFSPGRHKQNFLPQNTDTHG